MDATTLGGSPAYPWGEHGTHLGGMTMREFLSAQAMQGRLARHGDDDYLPEYIAKASVKYADALLAELAKDAP